MRNRTRTARPRPRESVAPSTRPNTTRSAERQPDSRQQRHDSTAAATERAADRSAATSSCRIRQGRALARPFLYDRALHVRDHDRPRHAADLEAIKALLVASGLPTAGVDDHWKTFIVARDGEQVVACGGAEAYQFAALIRSVAVAPEYRSHGHRPAHRAPAARPARLARTARVLSADHDGRGVLPKRGFKTIDRDEVHPQLLSLARVPGRLSGDGDLHAAGDAARDAESSTSTSTSSRGRWSSRKCWRMIDDPSHANAKDILVVAGEPAALSRRRGRRARLLHQLRLARRDGLHARGQRLDRELHAAIIATG